MWVSVLKKRRYICCVGEDGKHVWTVEGKRRRACCVGRDRRGVFGVGRHGTCLGKAVRCHAMWVI